jgi:predicted nucleic acid-binding protein
MSLFIDTGAFIALFDASDHHHAEAAQYNRAPDALAVQQVTSVGVVGETYT